MNYIQFHIGDWISGTRYLSALEKGIYIDLIALYYEKEGPIIRSYYDRIRNVYTNDEKKSFDFVVSEFFTEGPDGFHHKRCDEEIAKVREKSEKARKSIDARWEKRRKSAESDTNALQTNYERNTNVIRTNNERVTDVILTNNHKPITNISNNLVGTSENIDSAMYESAEDFGLEEQEKGADSEQDSQRPSNTPKRCAYTKVIELYHQLLPTLSTVNVDLFSRNRNDQAIVKARWMDFVVLEKCQTEAEVLYCFERYFQIVQKSQFLLGQTPNGSWKADFRWLMKKANFDKVLELKYS